MRLPRSPARFALALAALITAGCGSDGGSGQGSELTVLAAASLTGTFTELAAAFEDDHPGVTVNLAFESSATLAEQVTEGAPADVLATADEPTMQLVVDADGTAADPEVFATNRLALVVPAENPAGIDSFTDLDDPAVDYVVCIDSAPCGALARDVLDGQEVTNEPASEEIDVRAVLSKVELDEADAGIVYATDAVAAGDAVRTLAVPDADVVPNSYPIAVLGGAKEPELARAWVDLVLSDQGQGILLDAGFGPP
ncbi:MAG: molybdate ABC transporter substrate-binding protein [Nocardioidaceae bacterium]|nr:molybdate ABC transporter substrate-binding protein [Nocardioidaceae bacterium]